MNVCGRYRVGNYGVIAGDLECMGVAVPVSALEAPNKSVVIVDGIGSMELFSVSFREVV